MAKYIKIFLATITLAAVFNIGAASALPISNQADFYQDACNGISQTSNAGCGTGGDTFKKIASTVIGILSIIIGVVSVIMLIFAGFRFITANGDANTVNSARNMIIYAIVGIVIAVLSQVIVHEVTNTANTIQQHSYLNTPAIISNDS